MTDTPMTDKLVEAMAKAIKAEWGRQMDATPLPGPNDAPKSWSADGGSINLTEVARAALTAALAEIKGSELAKRLRELSAVNREFGLPTGGEILDEAADALDLLTAERERDRALLREALDALATLAVQHEKDGVWMCSWCNIKCHVSREFTHTPTCIVTRIAAALGEK